MDEIKLLLGVDCYNELLNGGFSTLQHIILADHKILQGLTGASSDTVQKCMYIASEKLLQNKFCTAKQIEPCHRISIGCTNLDGLLNGGIPVNGINELYGCSGVGKTQLSLQLALQIQLPVHLGGKGQEVVYICTEDVFPSKRLIQLACAFRSKYNVDICFEDRIYIEHIPNFVRLQKCLNLLPQFLLGKKVGLIIIDSIAGLFRSDTENPNYVARSQEFTVLGKVLIELQEKCKFGILTINQVVDNLSSGLTEPSLGLSWANNVTSRFGLSRNNTDPIRRFDVIFSPDLAPSFSNLLITPEGILDA
uniref:RecA family profile 1 domain-containing protein n=1 Tax=Dendroctonus ponderosae TaxID=77166 RepID=A0AAR5QJK9_DENPD